MLPSEARARRASRRASRRDGRRLRVAVVLVYGTGSASLASSLRSSASESCLSRTQRQGRGRGSALVSLPERWLGRPEQFLDGCGRRLIRNRRSPRPYLARVAMGTQRCCQIKLATNSWVGGVVLLEQPGSDRLECGCSCSRAENRGQPVLLAQPRAPVLLTSSVLFHA